VPVLAEAVRSGCVHQPGGAARRAALALPAAHQPDDDAHGAADRPCVGGVRPARQRAGGHLSLPEIAPVTDGRGLAQFVAFPSDHYRGDPLWVPQLRMDVRTLLTPGKNPFFQHAQAQYFLARVNGRTVGRIAAIKNDAHTREHGDRVGFYGFFECIDDPAAARALFDTAATWLRARGLRVMRGPMSPSINDECGLLVEGFDTPPTLMMPHNPPYYVGLHEGYGFAKAKDLLAFESPNARMPERIAPAAKVIAERKTITLRPLTRKRFRQEVELVKAYRMSGVDALMYHWIWTKGATHGYHWGEGGWILEDNVPMVNGALQLGFRPYKTYRIYDKPL